MKNKIIDVWIIKANQKVSKKKRRKTKQMKTNFQKTYFIGRGKSTRRFIQKPMKRVSNTKTSE